MHDKTVRLEALEDETPTIDFDQAYAPDPRAAQKLSARKRARQDETPHTPVVRAGLRQQNMVAAVLGLFAVIGVLALAVSQFSAAPLRGVPTPERAFDKQAQEAPSAPISATPAPTPAPRSVFAYASPDGALLGPIDMTRLVVSVAHYGSAWVAYQDGAGLVWVRSTDVPSVALIGPDLAPHTDLKVSDWTPDATPAPNKGQKAAPDRAARHATAVARDQQAHGQKGP